MAVVKTERVFFNGDFVQRKISCNAKGEFSAILPPELVRRLGVRSTIEGETLQAVESAWNDYMSKFNASNTSTRKVILCKFEADATIWRGDELVYRKGTNFHDSGVQIVFAAGVFVETTVKFDGKENVRYDAVEDSAIPSSVKIGNGDLWQGARQFAHLDWTPEREAAIADLAARFEDLILRMDEIFETTDKLLEVIASHQKLLPG